MIAGLKNLGPKSAQMLARAGIHDVDTLRRLGSVRAYVAVQQAGVAVSLNLLWAIEGALRDVHWNTVVRDSRMSLLMQLDDLQRRPAAAVSAPGTGLGSYASPAAMPKQTLIKG